MQIGIIGLGRMGLNMARRLLQGGHEVIGYNRGDEKRKELGEAGGTATASIAELVENLSSPKTVWIMLPAGDAVEQTIEDLTPLLSKGDLIIEGGNSYYGDDLRRARQLESLGINYMDAGVSGGVWGLQVGYCTMVGGNEQDFKRIEPLLETLAPPKGYLYCGPVGSGHYVKMVHNGIEYAMMEAYGEGFALLEKSPYGDQLNFKDVAHLWNQGSVIRSWLLELLENAFDDDPRLEAIKGHVSDSGEGRWTVLEAIERGVPATGIAHSLFKRFESRDDNLFSDRVLAALRKQFGGHAVVAKKE